jgi:hypothetical protein
MMPMISCAKPPNISATPNTTGVVPTETAFALIMLRMNVVTAKANSASGLFAGFGAFWLSFFALGQWFLKAVPLDQLGHVVGLFLYAFGIFVVVMLAASFARTWWSCWRWQFSWGYSSGSAWAITGLTRP